MKTWLLGIGAAAVVVVACGGHLAPTTDGGAGPGPDGGGQPVDAQPGNDVSSRPPPPPPPCEPNGVACINPSECCSGACVAGVCGGIGPPPPDAGPPPPPLCPPGSTQCSACVAQSCCSELQSCEMDMVCIAFYNCFQACYAPGKGMMCAQACQQQFTDSVATSLIQCGMQSCIPMCN